jgi:hypothetical protein
VPSRSSKIVSARRVSRHIPCPHSISTLTRWYAGRPISHQFAKELLVGLAGAEVDKLVETKGMDFIDREKAKHNAKEQVECMYDEHYVQGQGADQYDP